MTKSATTASIEFDDDHAEALAMALEQWVESGPLTYDKCFGIGVWRRLVAGDRSLPKAATDALRRLSGDPSHKISARHRKERVVSDGEVSELLRGTALLRMASIIGLRKTAEDRVAEEELVAAGLELALLMGHRRFIGVNLLTFVAMLEHVQSIPPASDPSSS